MLSSAASICEIAIKVTRGRADFAVRPAQIAHVARETGFVELSNTADTAARVADLPLHYRYPFGRLLVAQAMAEPVAALHGRSAVATLFRVGATDRMTDQRHGELRTLALVWTGKTILLGLGAETNLTEGALVCRAN